MIFLKALLIVVEVLSCLLLAGLILLQKSKSEGLGMAFGAGAGETLFGARAGNVLSRATVVLGIVFMANSLVLGVLFAKKDQTLMDQAAMNSAKPAAVAPAQSGMQEPETGGLMSVVEEPLSASSQESDVDAPSE